MQYPTTRFTSGSQTSRTNTSDGSVVSRLNTAVGKHIVGEQEGSKLLVKELQAAYKQIDILRRTNAHYQRHLPQQLNADKYHQIQNKLKSTDDRLAKAESECRTLRSEIKRRERALEEITDRSLADQISILIAENSKLKEKNNVLQMKLNDTESRLRKAHEKLVIAGERTRNGTSSFDASDRRQTKSGLKTSNEKTTVQMAEEWMGSRPDTFAAEDSSSATHFQNHDIDEKIRTNDRKRTDMPMKSIRSAIYKPIVQKRSVKDIPVEILEPPNKPMIHSEMDHDENDEYTDDFS